MSECDLGDDPFGTTCVYCGMAIDDDTPVESYDTDDNGDFLHYACSDPEDAEAFYGVGEEL